MLTQALYECSPYRYVKCKKLEILTAVLAKIQAFWNIRLHKLANIYQSRNSLMPPSSGQISPRKSEM